MGGSYPFTFFDYEAALFLRWDFLNYWSLKVFGKENITDLELKDENKKYF